MRTKYKIVTLVLALLVARPAAADTYWPMHDSAGIDHDVKNRWNESPTWCNNKLIVDELVKHMSTIQRVVITGPKIALVTVKDVRANARDALVSNAHSYGFWHLSADRTLVIEINCTAPTVCILNAHLIVVDGDKTCLERWGTVAYRGSKPPASQSKPDVYSSPHTQGTSGTP